jgi:outer membrane protein OmpA-like peptidoglycan-associated protein
MATHYDWHPDTRGGGSVFKVETRNLGWWIVLAIIVSVILHILLFFILTKLEHKAKVASEVHFRLATKQETIDRNELEMLLAQDQKTPENLDVKEPEKIKDLDITQKIDDFDLADMLKDEPIRMAPVDMATLGRSAPMAQVPMQALDMVANTIDLASSQELSNDLQDIRQKLVNASNQVTAEQPVLKIDAVNESKGVNTDEFFKKAAAKITGKKADELVKGYSTLDDLIGRTGGLQPGTRETAVMPSDILFGYNQAELMEGAELAMIKLAYLVETNPGATFIIEGHTDSFGADEFNRLLSEKRAKAVRDWLVSRLRINPANIQIIGKGKSEPLVPITGTADEQSLNRRVEIEIRKP